MKVFVVTSAQYSDYKIEAVFSTREKAERYVHEMEKSEAYCPNLGPAADIEEWTLDQDDDNICKTAFNTDLDGVSGAVFRTWNFHTMVPEHKRSEEVVFNDYREMQPAPFGSYAGHLVIRSTSYIDAEHSLKLAAEARQKYLRENQYSTSANPDTPASGATK